VRHEHFVPLVWTRDAPRAPEWPDPEAPPWDARSGGGGGGRSEYNAAARLGQ
jgi:hypothetical protein